MCGFVGIVDYNFKSGEDVIRKMNSTISHRGPDDNGNEVFNLESARICFGHSRLSIIDLSSAGHQPMSFADLCIVFNGEIYNYKEIKQDLQKLGHEFVSDSDTEVILHAHSEWGIACVEKFIGMFAYAILNKRNREVVLVRDRAGVKPLYYYWNNNLFLFSSELKAFHEHPDFVKEIDHNSFELYLKLGNVPSPHCIFKNCYKLNPGHTLHIDLENKTTKQNKYWDVNHYYNLEKIDISYSEAMKEVEKLMISAFQYRMVSDVPVGVFLSGGYDSTAVTAILQKNSTSKLKTYTIGFLEANNEAPFAKKIAEYLGTEHTEYYCSKVEAQDIIPTLPYYYDEPFSDSSAIPTILVSRFARNKVTVALSADGGDEIFGGYSYYQSFIKNLSINDAVPRLLRQPISTVMNFSSNYFSYESIRRKAEALGEIFGSPKDEAVQKIYHSYYMASAFYLKKIMLTSDNFHTKIDLHAHNPIYSDPREAAMANDYKIYLQNDILVKVDRATMSVGLEGREPFLDHRLIEYVAQLPVSFKLEGEQKRILKDIVYKYVPKSIMERPKAGFSIPVSLWLKKDLSYLIDDHLSASSISQSGLFNSNYIESMVRSFKNGNTVPFDMIWRILQFQMWYEKWC